MSPRGNRSKSKESTSNFLQINREDELQYSAFDKIHAPRSNKVGNSKFFEDPSSKSSEDEEEPEEEIAKEKREKRIKKKFAATIEEDTLISPAHRKLTSKEKKCVKKAVKKTETMERREMERGEKLAMKDQGEKVEKEE